MFSSRPVSVVLRCALLAVLCVAGARAGEPAATADGQVRVESVEVGLSPAGPVVLLKVGDRALPIFVDATVAESINAALRGNPLPRPLTHELVHTILSAFGGRVVEVAITLAGQVYRADLAVEVGGERRRFDSRSSDAIALAVHFDAPIRVPRSLLDAQGRRPRQAPDVRL